jgi:hypothetical protein
VSSSKPAIGVIAPLNIVARSLLMIIFLLLN